MMPQAGADFQMPVRCLAAVLLLANAVRVAGVEFTMWTDSTTAVAGSSCEFVSQNAGGTSAHRYMPYINNKKYCAVSSDLYANNTPHSVTYPRTNACPHIGTNSHTYARHDS